MAPWRPLVDDAALRAAARANGADPHPAPPRPARLLKRFPIEAIKVDREFVTGVVEDEGDRHILRAIVSMASAMDVAVIAEGVETREQARWLRHLGIKLVQGYAFGRPAPAATIEALLRDGLPLDRLALAFEPIDGAPAAARRPTRGLAAPAPAAGGATVTLGEAAVACGVSASTVRRWADTGRIAVVRTSGGHRRFPVAELRRLNGEAAARPTGPRRRAARRRAPRPQRAAGRRGRRARPPRSRAASTTAPPTGWFGSVPGREPARPLERRALATATRGTDYDGALDATRRLVTQADLAGASLLERHTFLERYGETVVRASQERERPARRARRRPPAVRRLRQVTLEAADARAAA